MSRLPRVLALIGVLACGVSAAQTHPLELETASRLMNEGRWGEAASVCEKILESNPENGHAWFRLSHARYGSRKFAEAIEAGKRAAEFPAVRAVAFYNLACLHALSEQPEEALEALREARRAGFADRELMASDPDLASIRDDPRFLLPGPRLYFDLEFEGQRSLPYSVDLPSEFVPGEEYPVLVGPGEGEPGEARAGRVFWGEDSAQRGWVVVESPAWLGKSRVEMTRALLDEIERRYQVEGGKFHLAGFSANSAGVFEVALAMPERFHSVTGLPGSPRSVSDEELRSLTGVRVNLIVGERDAEWREPAERSHERMTGLGIASHLEIIEGGEHVLEELFGGEFMDWLDAQR